MNFECSLEHLIEIDKIEVLYTYQYLWHITFPIIGGFLFGYVTGVISGPLLVNNTIFLYASYLVPITVAASLVSTLVTGFLINKFGRKRIIIASTLFFIIGSSIMFFNNLPTLIVGRFLVGIGIGLSSTCCPIYIAEITPKLIRGRIITLYQVSITFGIFMASVLNAVNYKQGESRKYNYSLAFSAIPALFELIGMFTVSESYRWLLSKNKIEDAKEIILRLKQIPERNIKEYIETILEANVLIENQLEEHRLKHRFMLCQILKDTKAQKSLKLGCSLQMLGQIVGINGILYYSTRIIYNSGVRNSAAILWLTSLVTFFNFIPSFLGFKLIDKIGRRKLAIISLLGILFSLVLLSVTLQVIKVCLERDINQNISYFCDEINASICKSIIENSCSSRYLWIVIMAMIFYIISFAIGMGPLPWTVTSEIYPIWCRSFNMSLSTAVNWLFNFIVTSTFPIFSDNYVIFWIYSFFTICGIAFVHKYLPETNQKTLEEIPQFL